MLLFIRMPYPILCVKLNFNTSHVTVYRFLLGGLEPPEENFNTSHVTVYRGTDGGLRLNEPHFNTSHVTVYPDPPALI